MTPHLESKVAIVDTGFLIGLHQFNVWALYGWEAIHLNPSIPYVIPTRVREEFIELMQTRKKDDVGLTLLPKNSTMEEILEHPSSLCYEELVVPSTKKLLESHPLTRSTINRLSYTDLSVAQAALDFYSQGKQVTVLTNDGELIKDLDILFHRGININVVSPYLHLSPQTVEELKLRTIAPGYLFGNLFNTEPDEFSNWYLCVAPRVEVAQDLKLDIIFEMIKVRGQSPPSYNSVRFIPLSFGLKTKNGQTITHAKKVWSIPHFAIYNKQFPNGVVIIENSKPLPTEAIQLNLALNTTGRSRLDILKELSDTYWKKDLAYRFDPWHLRGISTQSRLVSAMLQDLRAAVNTLYH